MLHERAASHRRRTVFPRELREAHAKGIQISFKDVESLANLQNQPGIVRILPPQDRPSRPER
jgi:hypothetical protein